MTRSDTGAIIVDGNTGQQTRGENIMDWDMTVVLWPTIYLLLAVAAVFLLWALKRKKSRKNSGWKELMAIAVFCLTASLLMVLVNTFDLHLSFITRLGIVSVILCLYAYYTYQRDKKRRK